MAMVLEAFVSFFVERVGDLIVQEVAMLLGVDADLQTLKTRLEDLRAYLRDAEKQKIRDESVRLWLSRLRDVMYDADDLIDDYMLEVDKHGQGLQGNPSSSTVNFRCPPLSSCFACGVRFRHEIGIRIAGINRTLEESFRNKPPPLQAEASVRYDDIQPWGGRIDRETSWQIDETDVVGIDLEARDLVERLTRGSNERCPIYAIAGMGGIGKTTLAQKIYNDSRVDSHFEVHIWVCVSQNVRGADLLKAIIESTGEECGGIQRKTLLETKVGDIVKGKRFLLVLDDVWEGKIWEEHLKSPLQSGAVNSRVLITTRNEDVAGTMGRCYSHKMRLLPEDEGWRMLCKAFKGDQLKRAQGLRETGIEIVGKCKGLPLAIKAIRGVLKRKDPSESAWRDVLHSEFWNLPEKEILPALYLSYEDLPPHLKQCFIYCSLFPEDFRFHKLNLVQMWVAEGFVKPERNRAIEDIADDYYRELMDRNLLQGVQDYFEDAGCKMHDVVRELARYVSQHGYLYRGTTHPDAAAARLRHLSFVGEGTSIVPEAIRRNECLRTLLLSKNPAIKEVPDDFFDRLRRLRVLDLTYTGIENLTDSVGNLIHLRFLNVSFTKLNQLPESIKNLRNLQTLKANGCKFLHQLPNGVVHLLNLTHLTVSSDTQLDQMPTGIEQLRNLHTLYGFVANENQAENNIKELRNLTQIRRLTMHRLEAVAGKAEAEEAVLKNKSNLRYLRLSCTRKTNRNQMEDPQVQKIEEIFQGLLPPARLESLHIEGYFGRQFPGWITKPTSLSDLRWLRLEDCKLCRQLPPLGRCSQLRVLHVWSCASVTTVGPEFLGGGAQGAPAFPLLEELYFRGMSNWKRWSGLEHGAVPVLRKLHIVKCPKLRSLPEGLQHATSLRELVIEGTEKLTAIENLPSVSELKTSHNQKLEVISKLQELKALDISNCPSIKETKQLDALDHLRLSGGDEMSFLPVWLVQIPSLQRLDLKCSADLLKRCSTDGEDWHMIQPLPRVEARSHDGSKYISYVKNPLWFESNLTQNGDSTAVAPSPYYT